MATLKWSFADKELIYTRVYSTVGFYSIRMPRVKVIACIYNVCGVMAHVDVYSIEH